MKRIVIFMFAILSVGSILAQPSGRIPEGHPANEMRGQHQHADRNDDKPSLEHFPEIPGLTLQQREKVGSVLTKERQDVNKIMTKKMELQKDMRQASTQKNRNKLHKKVEKNDRKIQKIRSKSDKKIKKVLTDEQYVVFLQKRKDFRFKELPRKLPMNGKHKHPGFENRQQPY